MAGDVTQNFGCTGFAWEPAYGSCAHFHQGIDIVAPYGTKVRASGDGVGRLHRLELRRRRGPGLDRDHRPQSGLQTWYAHMQPKYPGNISEGSHVSAGQVIGYEGNTGHSTGAHLHWAVRLNDDIRQPEALPLGRRRPTC